MLLYHGCNVDISAIDLLKCRPYKDFGQGFYLTVLKDQAEKMAARVSRIHGSSPVINVCEFNESSITASELKVKDFGDTTYPAWAKFEKNNRDRSFFLISYLCI